MALLIDIEGIDGSGKATQSARLHQRLLEAGQHAALISFPRYEATLFGKAIGDYLNGRFGSLQDVSPFLVSLLYAGDRFESRLRLRKMMAENDAVVLDRYVASNIAHQGAKADGDERAEVIEWIRRIEFEVFDLPRPDVVVLLDVPSEQAQRLIAKKQSRSYTDKPSDLQESDTGYLERVREIYLDLATRLPEWHTIQCCQSGGGVRPVEQIAEDVWRVLQEHFSK